jgi:hypothetical protein
MRFSPSSFVVFALTIAAAVPAFTQNPATSSSPFADKAVDSYSDSTDPVTNERRTIRWGDLKPDEFGPRSIKFSDDGLRKLRPAPAPGIHPRILFTPGDLPEMRQRMKQSRAGQIMYNHLLAYSAALRGRYDENAAYAKPDLWQGNYRGSHGSVQLWYYHDKDSPFNPANHTFERLVAGDQSVDPKTLWPVFAIDALRCLIDDDKPGAQQLARAVDTAMRHDQAARNAERAAKNLDKPLSAPVSGGAGGQDFGYLYDFLYNDLTPAQRTAWHDELASSTWSHDNYGTFNAAVSTRSNWATFTYWLIPLLAIEGEPGYNELKAEGIYRGYRNFLTYGIFPDGAVVEGEAKDQLGGDGLVAMAMRRHPNLFGHPFLRAYAMDFLPHSIVPNPDYKNAQSDFPNGPFLKFDLLGGIGMINASDALTLKYMFPNDKRIDWVYRNEVGENYDRLPNRGISGYWDDLLLAAIFATDFDPANNDPAKLGLGLTFFSGERAMMLTRSDWGRNAMELGMHTRELNGGHAFADRNSIFLFAQGRAWVPLNQRNGDTTAQSEVVIDNKQQSVNSPGRMVDYQDQPMATFAVGDASYAWDWNLDTLSYVGGYTAEEIRAGNVKIKPGWEPEMHSINNFAYSKLPDEYANAPLFNLHSWIAQDGLYTPVVRQPNYPVIKAFRTAGLVRGANPYSLIVDDIQKDVTPHHYDWQLLLEQDLDIVKVQPLPARSGVLDITLAAHGSAKRGEPMLLVRILNCNSDAIPAPKILPLGDPRGDKKKPILVVPADSISPAFKVLLYAYRQGDPLPETEWNSAHTVVTVELPSYRDTVSFESVESGKTDLKIVRNEAGNQSLLVNVSKPVPALAPGAPLSASTQLP